MSLAGTLGRASKFFALYAFTQSDALDQTAFLQLSMSCKKMARVLGKTKPGTHTNRPMKTPTTLILP